MKKKNQKTKIDHMLTPEREEGHINWFPGHMNKAIKEIKKRLKLVDIVLELRDARSPLVTSNPMVTEAIGEKSKLILINKSHLANQETLASWQTWFAKQGEPFLVIQSFDNATLKKIISQAKSIVQKRREKSNPGIEEKKTLRMMTLGLPNTGKSTIINKLAKRNATKVADRPGQTRQQQWVKIEPGVEMLDTPGIMPPKVVKFEHGQWLSALHAIPDTIVQAEVPACYLIETLLKQKSSDFLSLYKFNDDEYNLYTALDHIAKVRGCLGAKGVFDYDRVYHLILSDFREGRLGQLSFGQPPSHTK